MLFQDRVIVINVDKDYIRDGKKEIKEVINIRDPNRLYNFYNEVTRLHMTHMPDWRAGQFWLNFLGWLQNKRKCDPFPRRVRNAYILKRILWRKEDVDG